MDHTGKEVGVRGNEAVLQVRGINKSFGAVQALKNVDFEVRPGEVTVLIGDNGAGKSTLINLKGIFGANVFSGQGAGTGVRQTGKKDQVSVVAFDASPTQVEDLRRGNVDVLIAQHPNDIGDKGVRIAVDYLKSDKEPSSKQITTGFTTVTRENLDKPEVEEYLYKAEC
jgi:ABC-type phosphonate transport system ATPase subunit